MVPRKTATTTIKKNTRCSLMYHNILARAFRNMHGLPKAFVDDDGLDTSEFVQQSSPEAFHKALRVRAGKANEYFSSQATLPKLFISTLSVTPMEKVMFQFMYWQKTEAYLKKVNPPVVTMSHPISSPACQAIRTLCDHMTTERLFVHDPESLSIFDVAASF